MSIYAKTADGWLPIVGGVSEPVAANFTDEPTGTYSEDGVDYKYLTVTGTQSVNFDVAGFADILLIAGGGNTLSPKSGGATKASGGGAGGVVSISSAFIPIGNPVATIGAGGTGVDSYSSFLGYFAVGGANGTGGTGSFPGSTGGSGSGGVGAVGGAGIPGQGNDGGSVSPTGFAAGGGAGSAGVGAVAGAGRFSSITGTSFEYAKGGSTTGVNVANTGDAGQGSVNGSSKIGNSGVLIIRVVV